MIGFRDKSAGAVSENGRNTSETTFIGVYEVCLEHRIKNEKSPSLSTASVRVSLQKGSDEINLN